MATTSAQRRTHISSAGQEHGADVAIRSPTKQVRLPQVLFREKNVNEKFDSLCGLAKDIKRIATQIARRITHRPLPVSPSLEDFEQLHYIEPRSEIKVRSILLK